MEHYFRIALCMFLFVGYLQAMPTCSKSVSDVKQHDLRVNPQKVKCGGETFTSPSNVTDECEIAALRIFKAELIRALKSEKCEDKEESIGATLDALPEICPQPTSSPDCKWEGDESRKQFAAFWEDFTTLLKKSNSAPAKGTQ